MCIRDSHKAPLDWMGVTQGATARSTPEAEVTSASDLTFRSALPIQETLFQALGCVLPIKLGVDNSTAEQIIGSGKSRRLAYLRRHQRVSLSSLNETYGKKDETDATQHAGNLVFHQPSIKMPVDIITKPLPALDHWRCCQELGLGLFDDGPPLGAGYALAPGRDP